MIPEDRHYILCIDEMSLKTYLFYNIDSDEVVGFQDNNNNVMYVVGLTRVE